MTRRRHDLNIAGSEPNRAWRPENYEELFHQELGKKLWAAFLAQQQGISLSCAFKKVNQPVGDPWLMLAEIALDAYAESEREFCNGCSRDEPSNTWTM